MTGTPSPSSTAALALRRRLEHTLAPLVPEGARVALVGSGLSNVGDCAIAVATRTWLASRRAVVLELDRRTYDGGVAARWLGRDGVLLLAGGGTIGDVWRSQEDLRRRALADLVGLRTVHLPQTIHFEDDRKRAAASAVYGARPATTLLVRDDDSLAIAQAWGADAALAPDMAFLLDMHPTGPATRDVLWLLRDDKESARGAPQRTLRPSPVAEAVDWPDLRDRAHRLVRRVVARSARRSGDAPRRRAWIARLDAGATRRRVAAGVATLSEARVVVTDRLHASILAMLLRRPTVVVPDRHGKLRSFHRTWTRGADGIVWCESIEQARAAVRGLLAAPGVEAVV